MTHPGILDASPVLRTRCKNFRNTLYKIPARYDDLLTIEIWLTKLQGVRVNFAYRVSNQDEGLVLEGETFHACAGLNEMPKRIPKMLIGQLQPYLRESESKRIVA